MPISRIPSSRFQLSWCSDPAQEPAIVALFLAQADTRYISHAELQEQRAVAPGQWRDDFPEVLAAQVREALAHPASTLIATAHSGDALAGIAFVSIDELKLASRTFASLDDLIVDARFQGRGLGRQLFDWVCAQLRKRGIERLFLESGIANEEAHGFFEARGCTPVSLTMFKELGRAGP